LIETQPADHHDQPGANVLDRIEVGAQEPGESLLHYVLSVAIAAKKPVGDVEKEAMVVRPRIRESLVALDH
jgi:hypothetical protein